MSCRTLTLLILLVGYACLVAQYEAMAADREPTEWRYTGPKGSSARVRAAHQAKDAVVKELFDTAKVAFPPAGVLFRVFKQQERFEVWATAKRGTAYTLIATYKICYASGVVGPKRKQGDMQVPEGFYIVDSVNPSSQFYLSLHVNYPNASDRVLSHRRNPGSAIMIHGNCVSAGCMAMSDERIQEIWVITEAVRQNKGPVDLYIFPSSDWDSVLHNSMFTSHKEFWLNLKEGHDRFEKTRLPVRFRVDREGRYRFE